MQALYNTSVVLNDQKIELGINTIAKQARSSVLYKVGQAVLLATICVESKPIDNDFLPLSVQYIEKFYAIGKIPSGFIKREGKPSTFEILTSRIIDRSIRPLFPDGFYYPVQISVIALSIDPSIDLQLHALLASSIVLSTANINGIKSPTAVRLGSDLDSGTTIINPTTTTMANSGFDLFVSGIDEDLLMIEMQNLSTQSEVSEEDLIQYLEIAKTQIKSQTALFSEITAPFIKEVLNLALKADQDLDAQNTLVQTIKTKYKDELNQAIGLMARSERSDALNSLKSLLISEGNDENTVSKALAKAKKDMVRANILDHHIRPDGRGLEDIRKIDIHTNILPAVHSSALFTRGQTQALVTCTLGGENDAENTDYPSSNNAKDKFMVHYNFPPFSVGEAMPMMSISRRELGHGNLGKRALNSTLLDRDISIRLVSEILSSNGSSSMATVCGGSLALRASNVKVKDTIAGVAMGLVSSGTNFAILSDITGLEDHEGDMDFKVAGARGYITAMQMDIKLGGISQEILSLALAQAKRSRLKILDIMEEAIKAIDYNASILPVYENIKIDTAKIPEIIGRGGTTIREIIDKSGASIDIDRDAGMLKLCTNNAENMDIAKKMINEILSKAKPEVGEVFRGKVAKIMEFGAFIAHPSGVDGLLHAKKITPHKGCNVADYIKEGEELECKIIAINSGKIELDKA